jgi:hypothetical protein
MDTVLKLLDQLPLSLPGSHGPAVLKITRLTINVWDAHYDLGIPNGNSPTYISGYDEDLIKALQKLMKKVDEYERRT